MEDEINDTECHEVSEEESASINAMIAQADAEIFAERKKVKIEFESDDFSVEVI